MYGVSSKDEGESPPNFGVSVQFNLPNSLGEYLVKVVILYVIMYILKDHPSLLSILIVVVGLCGVTPSRPNSPKLHFQIPCDIYPRDEMIIVNVDRPPSPIMPGA